MTYSLRPPSSMPDGLRVNEKLMQSFADIAARRGVPQATAQQLYDDLLELERADLEREDAHAAQEVASSEASLRKRFGDNYDHQISRARSALNYFGLGEKEAGVIEALTGGAPNFVELLSFVGEQLYAPPPSNSSTISSRPDNNTGAANVMGGEQTLATAKAKIRQLRADPEFVRALKEPQHPRHEDVVAEWEGACAQLAAVEAPRAVNHRTAAEVQADIAQFKKDRDLVRALKNPVDPLHHPADYKRHAQAKAQWNKLNVELTAAEAELPRRGFSAAELRAERDQLTGDRAFMKVFNKQGDPRYPAAKAKFDDLNTQIANAVLHEEAAAAPAAAEASTGTEAA